MSSDADAHKVGLIPVTLMVSGEYYGVRCFSVTCKPWPPLAGLPFMDGW